jgi:DNA-binding CsgD family transcriptional regulator
MHLTHAYRKLDITGRAALPAALADPAAQPA